MPNADATGENAGPDTGSNMGRGREKPRRRKPRKASPKSLENAALYYLKRFSSSEENLRRVMMRRVERSARAHGTDREEGAAWVGELVARLARAGLVDDRRYAEGRVHALHARGTSIRVIAARLREKGVPGEIIEESIQVLRDEQPDAELEAAIRLARRRRIGPFRIKPPVEGQRQKDLAALARAGFDYGTAMKVADAKTEDELEEG